MTQTLNYEVSDKILDYLINLDNPDYLSCCFFDSDLVDRPPHPYQEIYSLLDFNYQNHSMVVNCFRAGARMLGMHTSLLAHTEIFMFSRAQTIDGGELLHGKENCPKDIYFEDYQLSDFYSLKFKHATSIYLSGDTPRMINYIRESDAPLFYIIIEYK